MRARYIVLEHAGDHLWSLTYHGGAKEALAQVNESGGLLVQPVPLSMAPRRRRAAASLRGWRVQTSPNGDAAKAVVERT